MRRVQAEHDEKFKTSYLKRDNEAWDVHLNRVLGELQSVYKNILLPIEERYCYDTLKPSWFSETLLQTKPFVTFMGPFSSGKSTFINHLLESNYLWTGPQPTTDKFTVVLHGDQPQQISGRVLAAQADLPFRGLNQFGDQFLEHLDGYQINHDLLRSVSLIDTPGVLEAAGEIHSRRYDYVKVCRWFVERSDLIFVLFDPTKLDAGLELKMLFKHSFKGCESKIRIVLNKADSVGPQELMRVYGSLFWNLSNMIKATEPPRVYVGSFWDQAYRPGTNHALFTEEKADLLFDLTESVPLQSLDKRVASVLKRAKSVLVHTLVCSMLKQGLPKYFGKEKASKEAISNIEKTFQDIMLKFKFICSQDFSDPEEYKLFFEKVNLVELSRYEKIEKEGHIAALHKLIEKTLPDLLQPIRSANADPRDRKSAQKMQEKYYGTMANQLEGKSGIQGAQGEAKPSAMRIGLEETARGKEIGYDPTKMNRGYGSGSTGLPKPSQSSPTSSPSDETQQQSSLPGSSSSSTHASLPMSIPPGMDMMQMMQMMQTFMAQQGIAGSPNQGCVGVPAAATPSANPQTLGGFKVQEDYCSNANNK